MSARSIILWTPFGLNRVFHYVNYRLNRKRWFMMGVDAGARALATHLGVKIEGLTTDTDEAAPDKQEMH